MRRGLWFVAGAASGVYALTRVRRAAEALTPDGLRDRLAGLSLGAHLLREEVRAEAAVRETDLRRQLGLVPAGVPELPSPRPATDQRSDQSTRSET